MSDAMQHADDGAVHLTAATFDEALAGSPGPTLVDFWAPWCGPCKAIAPMIDDLARELSGRATVGKVNVEDEPALAVRFSVMALPALMFFKGDQTAETLVGAVPKAVLLERLQALGG